MVLKFEPWGDDPLLEWDEDNEEKFWQHHIRAIEVIKCFENLHNVTPHRKSKSEPEKYTDRYVVRGVTDGGRKLRIIVKYKGGNVVRPITGWEE